LEYLVSNLLVLVLRTYIYHQRKSNEKNKLKTKRTE
jgi:hypothetical protein